MNVVFCVLSGFSVNIAMLIVCRTLAGGASASAQAVGAGSLADVWDNEERGRAMGIYYLGPLLGVMLAPIFSGALTNAFGWRSTMWFLAAYGFVTLVLILFGLPETLPRRKEHAPPADPALVVDGQPLSQAVTWLRRIFLDPLRIIKFFRYPAIQCTIWCSAITSGSLYILNNGIQPAFAKAHYNYSPWVIGLLYIPGSFSYVLSSIFGGIWLDKVMIRKAVKQGRYDSNGKLIVLPEDRMQENIWIAAVLVPCSFLLFGWVTQFGIHVAVALLATLSFGVSSMLVFVAANTMLTEFMPDDSSSGIALNNFVRNIFTCVGLLVAQPLLDAMGYGGLFSLLAGLCWVVIATCIWLLKKSSRRWREAMDNSMARKSETR
ncbi:major facilitator superfamily transporter [Microdochium trichocladiopsis]|uniref:Major facilitator superfamily transporter n=1 Tax=Microdochium trichocladiopsis TaxID=1682393 RepID=A0A9P9BSJ7_9PEZI|nr:major facilitator superfamily transporter [Microdochium trichocladiopsis]KAH7028916.1 major facilitator superfamily transporter [Microdochium trichocladiopsis]